MFKEQFQKTKREKCVMMMIAFELNYFLSVEKDVVGDLWNENQTLL